MIQFESSHYHHQISRCQLSSTLIHSVKYCDIFHCNSLQQCCWSCSIFSSRLEICSMQSYMPVANIYDYGKMLATNYCFVIIGCESSSWKYYCLCPFLPFIWHCVKPTNIPEPWKSRIIHICSVSEEHCRRGWKRWVRYVWVLPSG